jgi:UDP-N-acetylmuramate--alanine ligase
VPAEPPPAGVPADLDLTARQRVHVVGVGGAGMSAIASVLAAMGHDVSGSDLKASPVTDRLAAQGVAVSVGHRAEQVVGADVVTFSPAVRSDNVELVEAARRGVPVVRRAEILAAIAETRRCLAVAGTHGKTTSSSMLALILVEAGLHPSFLIGADVNEIGTNAVWDDGEWLVLEADESYGSFGALRPEIAVLTNVEPDHLDHYGTFDDLKAAFGGFLGGASSSRVVCADDAAAAEIGRTYDAVSVGVDAGADYVMSRLTHRRSSVGFDLAGLDGPLGRLEVPVPGIHNARNAAVAAVAAMLAGAPFPAGSSSGARSAA